MAAERPPPKEGPTSSVTDDSYHKSICPRAMAAGTVSRYKTGLRLAKHRIPYNSAAHIGPSLSSTVSRITSAG